LASAIYSGIKKYLHDKPQPLVPMGSHWFVTKKHKVVKGETLSQLAVDYGVPQSRIKEANGLKNNELFIGQVLTIPIQEKS